MKAIRTLSAVVLSALALTILPFSAVNVSAAGDVKINEKNFPDRVLRNYIKDSFDLNKDGKLSQTEISKATHVDVSEKGVTTLKGIEYLTALTYLHCGDNSLTSIDLGKNTALEDLNCTHNKLTTIDLSKNTALTNLVCSSNKLSVLDLSKNTKLTDLHCDYNALTSLDLSKNTKLLRLDFAGNKLTGIDLSKNTKLTSLMCECNQLTELDISKLKDLEILYCTQNKLSCLDLSQNTKLKNTGWKEQASNFTLKLKAGQTIWMDVGSANPDASKTSYTTDNEAVLGLKNTYDNSIDGYMFNYWAVTGKQAGTAKFEEKGKKCAIVQVLYKDVTKESDFWYEPTYYLTDKNVVKGYDKQTNFKPANDCTRAQMLTFMWRLAGEPEPNVKDCKFPDVKKSDYFYKAVLWAVENGITTGYKDGTFKPKNVCTRAQTVTFLWRMAGTPDPRITKKKFTDIKTSDYFYKAVLWASAKGIVAGYSDGTFKPQGKCLRRQMVTFLYKYDKYVNGKG